MGRLIDAEKLKAHYAWWKDGTREMTMAEAKDIIDEIVDLQPTVEKHGHWVKNDEGDFNCSICNAIVESDEKSRHYWGYCYHCGARMEVKEMME